MTAQKEYSDTDLILAISAKTDIDRALQYLYKRYYRPLERYVLANSGNELDAQDLVQEVMVSFVDLVQRDKYRGEASIKSLLFTLARNHWITVLRKRGSDGKREERYEIERDQLVPDVSEQVMDVEAQQVITTLFDRLGATCRQILTLFYYQDLSMKEILRQTEYTSEQVLRNKKYKCLKEMTDHVMTTPGLADTLKDALQRTR